MTELLLRRADRVVTMDAARREIAGGDVLIRDGVVAARRAACLTRAAVS